MDSKQIRNLMEAYSQVHAPQEIDEKFVDPTGVDYDPKRSGMKSPDKKMLEKHKELRAKGDPESVARAGKIAKAKLQMALRTNEEVAELDERFHRGGGSMRPASETQSSAPSSNSSSKKGRSKAAGMAARMRFMNADKEQVKQAAEGLEIGEAVKGASPHTMQMRRDAAAERRAGIKPLPAKKGEEYAKYKMAQMAYAKRKRMSEEVDIFDVVLEFLQAEGFAETLEEAKWMMANLLNKEEIDIIVEAACECEDEEDEDEMKKGKKSKKEKEEKEEKEEEEDENIKEATYSAKAARAGKDIGKPGKAFVKIAKSAAKHYGSMERGKKVAGAVLAKLRAKKG